MASEDCRCAEISVLAARFDAHVVEQRRDDDERDLRLKELEVGMARLRTDFEVLQAKVTTYAAIGGALGTVLMNLGTEWVRALLTR